MIFEKKPPDTKRQSAQWTWQRWRNNEDLRLLRDRTDAVALHLAHCQFNCCRPPPPRVQFCKVVFFHHPVDHLRRRGRAARHHKSDGRERRRGGMAARRPTIGSEARRGGRAARRLTVGSRASRGGQAVCRPTVGIQPYRGGRAAGRPTVGSQTQ